MAKKQPAYTTSEAGIKGADEFILDEVGLSSDITQLRQMAHMLCKVAKSYLLRTASFGTLMEPELAVALDQMTYVLHALVCTETGGYQHSMFSDAEIAKVASDRAASKAQEEVEQWLPSGATILGVHELND